MINGFDGFVGMGKQNVDAFVKSSTLAAKGMEEMSKAFAGSATQSVEKAYAAVQGLAACKSPTEFMEMYTRLARENVETSITESRRFAEMATGLFNKAIEPMNAAIKPAK